MPTFDDDDHTFLRHVADRVALAIVNLALYEDLQRELTERREAQSRFEMVIENTPLVAIRGFDLDGVVRHWNRASENLFGYAAGEVTGHRVLDTLPVEAGHGEFETMFREVVGSGRAALPREREVVTKSGQKRTVYTTVFPLHKGGEPTEVFCMDVDITERKMQEEQLAYLATHDVLTGLPNRRSLEESLQTALALSRCGVANALIFVDVDNFKLVNDTLGHDAGDEMLVTVAGLLKDNLRGTDLLARLGGDEFAALLRDTSIEEAQVIAERLRRAVEESCFTVEGLTFDLSLSIGVVAVGNQATPALVLSQGDAAMYKAKNHGRNRLAVYDSEYDERTRLFEANREAAQIKDALRDDRLTLYYQPVVRLTDGSVAYYEALARLLAANGEALAAGAFIPTAERFGLIPQVTRLVVQQAVQALRAHPSVRLSVNLSGLDLCDAALPGFIEAYLRDQGVDPTRLGFEVTETALIKDLAQAERWIARIKSLGCRFALDDFGAGFVSFAYLRNLTVDQLKIDGSLVRALESDHTQSAFVQALHLLATTQGKETVAECVENGNVVRLLKELGVTYGQGYHLGRPSPFLP
jgi:diguanylate cyclase (GGDEF)-like protein/PAS domain S-box-containing protein